VDPREPNKGRSDPEGPHPITEFTPEPTRDLAKWRWLWKGDVPFPIRSHRGFMGGLRLELFPGRVNGPSRGARRFGGRRGD